MSATTAAREASAANSSPPRASAKVPRPEGHRNARQGDGCRHRLEPGFETIALVEGKPGELVALGEFGHCLGRGEPFDADPGDGHVDALIAQRQPDLPASTRWKDRGQQASQRTDQIEQ